MTDIWAGAPSGVQEQRLWGDRGIKSPKAEHFCISVNFACKFAHESSTYAEGEVRRPATLTDASVIWSPYRQASYPLLTKTVP